MIFDCDGVLVDSERLSVQVEVAMFADLGWATTEDEIIERFVGRSVADMHREVEIHLGRSLPSFPEQYRTRVEAAFRSELMPVDGIIEALDALETLGIPTSVASSGTHERMRLTLGLTGLYDRFGVGGSRLPPRSHTGSRPRTSSCALRTWLGSSRAIAWSSRTVDRASSQHAPPACRASATPVGSLMPALSRARGRPSSTTCGCFRA